MCVCVCVCVCVFIKLCSVCFFLAFLLASSVSLECVLCVIYVRVSCVVSACVLCV